MTKSKRLPLVAAAIVMRGFGNIIGPYFLGTSLETIQRRFTNKLINPNFDLIEIGVERVRGLRGFLAACKKYKTVMFRPV